MLPRHGAHTSDVHLGARTDPLSQGRHRLAVRGDQEGPRARGQSVPHACGVAVQRGASRTGGGTSATARPDARRGRHDGRPLLSLWLLEDRAPSATRDLLCLLPSWPVRPGLLAGDPVHLPSLRLFGLRLEAAGNGRLRAAPQRARHPQARTAQHTMCSVHTWVFRALTHLGARDSQTMVD